MKLTNISLAILVAVGVAACGGSDDNNGNKPVDPKPNPTPTPTPTPDNNKPVDPERKAPDMTVQDAVKQHVTAAKTTYAAAGVRDLVTGYAPNAGIVGAAGDRETTAAPYAQVIGHLRLNNDPTLNDGTVYADNATDAANVKRLAITKDAHNNAINYVATGQLRKDAANPAFNGSVLANPGFTYALGKDGLYYRMEPLDDAGTNVIQWTQTKPSTKYRPISNFGTTGGVGETNPRTQFEGGVVDQDKLVFIPNVTKTTGTGLAVANADALGINGTPGGVDRINPKNLRKFSSVSTAVATQGAAHAGVVAGQFQDPTQQESFAVDHGEVIFRTATFLNKSYDLTSSNAIEKVDLNDIPLNKSEIQYLPLTVNYDVKDTKGTVNLVDDTITKRETKTGAMKAYNLPYSLAFVTVNQKGAEKKHLADGAAARNLFDYSTTGKVGDLGAFQVVGYQAPYLPENGRADYTGKSFGVDSQGDVKLRADFGIRGAHIAGSIVNRTYADGTGTLPEITLANIQLSSPGSILHTTGTTLFGNQADTGEARSRNHAGKWDVQLFGPDAQEAGGVVQFFNPKNVAAVGTPGTPGYIPAHTTYEADDAVIPGGVEVFTTQRGQLTTDSNTASDANVRN
jgi:hypothetical protein